MENPRSFASSLASLAYCAFVAAAVLPANAALTNRWSFNNPSGSAPTGTAITDSVGTSPGVVVGSGATFTSSTNGTALTLPGTTTGNQSPANIAAYVDFPNGIISSKTNLTVEIWATPVSIKNWQRLFDFGRMATSNTALSNNARGAGALAGEILPTASAAPNGAVSSDDLSLAVHRLTTANTQRVMARLNGATELGSNTAATLAVGTQYHLVCTFTDGAGSYGAAGAQVAWYLNGNLGTTLDVNYHLSSIQDYNNWLGRSMYTADNNANIAYNEFRLYNHALTTAEIAADYAAGPDTIGVPPDPVAAPTPNHLWTFTETASSSVASGRTFTDSIGGTVATLRGNGGTLNGTSVTLPGNTTGNQTAAAISAYLDLPNGLISAQPGISVEAWATPLSSKNWQRLFDFGRSNTTSGTGAAAGEIIDGAAAPAYTGYDNLSLSINNAGTFGTHQLEGQISGGTPVANNAAVATTAGTEYHYVLTVTDGAGAYGASGCQAKWYRNGSLQNTLDLAFHLSAMADVNNWIGRSQYGADSNSNLALNELRIYNHPISAGEVQASYDAGPDPSSGPPEPPVPAPVPTSRWNFNSSAGTPATGTTFTDSASGEIATLRGNGGVLTGTALTLPGTTNGNQTAAVISAYLDLPNGIVSSKTSVSFEAWATPVSSKTWQRLFDFGRSSLTVGSGAATGEIIDGATAPGAFTAYDNLLLSLNNNGTFGSHRLEGRLNGGTTLTVDTDLSTSTTAGVEHHYVLTVLDGAGAYAASGCQAKWYRDAVLQGTVDLNYHLNQMSDVNNWIGRSQWAADMNSNLSLNELRIYNRALSAGEVSSSLAAGANPVFPPPVVVNDSATIHPGQKVLLAVLANDTGLINPNTVEIVSAPATGTATIQPSGKILYSHAGSGTAPVSFTYRVSGEGGQSQVATVNITVSSSLRIPSASLNVPADPPPTAVQVVAAYPGVTFTKPLVYVSPPGDTKRLFVGELGGKFKVIPDVTAVTPTSSVVLDLVTTITTPARTPTETLKPGGNPECGLLGAVFHPNYATNGYFYVAYSIGKSTDTAVWYQRLSRFTVPAAQIGLPAPVADPASELILIEQRDRDDNHNGGDLHFGADGYLYMSIGDEANPNDTRKNSQRIDMNFFGGMLRIDVDKKPGNIEPSAYVNPTAAALGYSAVNAIPRDEIPLGSEPVLIIQDF